MRKVRTKLILISVILCFHGIAVIAHGNNESSDYSLSKISNESKRSTSDVWQHHIDSWVNRDLESIVRDYSENSIMVINGRTYKGISKIKNVFKNLFGIFDQGTNKIDPTTLIDNLVYITWNFHLPNNGNFYGTDTFVIEDGIIKIQTIYSTLYEIKKESL